MSHYKIATALWNGQPERLPHGFTMTRSAGGYEHIAVCETWTHPSGPELRLSIDGTSPTTSVVRSPAEMRVMVETWKVALLENGWR